MNEEIDIERREVHAWENHLMIYKPAIRIENYNVTCTASFEE